MNIKAIFFVAILVLSQAVIFTNFNVVGEDDSFDFKRQNQGDTTFVYYSQTSLSSVEVVGEWDGWIRHNLTYLNGIYSIDLNIDEGFYCYKFIIDEINWVLDPSNGYRKYCDGILNSGIIVENFSYPRMSIAQRVRRASKSEAQLFSRYRWFCIFRD